MSQDGKLRFLCDLILMLNPGLKANLTQYL